MNLNLFEEIKNANKNFENNKVNKFIEELTKSLRKMVDTREDINNENNELDEYNIYEKRKIFLDNKSRRGNELIWIMDNNSVCISEHGDGGPTSINEINLPQNSKVGQVYEKIDGKYVYNEEITEEINKIVK